VSERFESRLKSRFNSRFLKSPNTEVTGDIRSSDDEIWLKRSELYARSSHDVSELDYVNESSPMQDGNPDCHESRRGTAHAEAAKKKRKKRKRKTKKPIPAEVAVTLEKIALDEEQTIVPTSSVHQRRFPFQHVISSPPGASLAKIADFFCSSKTMQEVVTPTITDLRREYFTALSEGRGLKAEWCRVRGYWSFFTGVGLFGLSKTAVKLWRLVSLK